MKKSKVILGLKPPKEYSMEERKMIIEEYLRTGCKKRAIWEKYTGEPLEKGRLLEWMRQLGYEESSGRSKSTRQHSSSVNKLKADESREVGQLKERIEQLEQALVHSELRATAYETMIDVAEKELRINIRKKSYTKQSTK